MVGLLILAVCGGIVGWIASLLVKGTGLGLAGEIVLSIVARRRGSETESTPAARALV